MLAAVDAFAGGRYISLTPATTEILFALGLEDEVVGVSSYCDYPAQAKAKESVGSFSQPNAEKILSLKPDIVFVTGLEQAAAVRQLRELNLRLCISDPRNIEELFLSIREIGRLTGRQKQADALISGMRLSIAEVNSQVGLVPLSRRPKVFVEIWHSFLTCGSNSFINEIITASGGRNIAADIVQSYINFSSEEVISRDPEYIFLAYMDKQGLKNISSRLGWERISAVKNQRIFSDIDPAILLRPGPRVAEAIVEMHKRLYPIHPAILKDGYSDGKVGLGE